MLSARHLLSSKRFDIPAKTLYAFFRENQLESAWGKEVYAHHLKTWNGFHESLPKKDGFAAFEEAFDSLLDDMKAGRFDPSAEPIPLAADGTILNGAHRTAGAITYGLSLETVASNKPAPDWSYEFLVNKCDIVADGLPVRVADAMALELCRLRELERDVYAVLLFPSAEGKNDQAKGILESAGDIYYHKEVALSENGGVNLIYQTYRKEPWVGAITDCFHGAQRKASRCFAKPGNLRFFLVRSDSLAAMVKAKENIRALYGISNHSVHINDTYEETLQLGELLLNENSIHFLNQAVLSNRCRKFWKLFEELLDAVEQRQLSSDQLVIGGSGPLGAYGIRDVSDLDFLPNRTLQLKELGQKISGHSGQWLDYYQQTSDDILYNPNHHFSFCGVRFATLDVVREMKTARWEKKDRKDIELINRFEQSRAYAPAKPKRPPPLSMAALHLKKLAKSIRKKLPVYTART